MSDWMPKDRALLMPFLHVQDIDQALSFYEGAFGFVRTGLNLDEQGKTQHAELEYHGAVVAMLTPRSARPGSRGAGSSPEVAVYLQDVDAAYRKALQRGAKGVEAPRDLPWGERIGLIQDPDGHPWLLVQAASG